MTEEVLTKAIEKAEKNGYTTSYSVVRVGEYVFLLDKNQPPGTLFLEDVKTVIFSHEFLKAFFGEENCKDYYDDFTLCDSGPQPFLNGTIHYPYPEGAGVSITQPSWAYHACRMVLSEDPVEYLKEFLWGQT